MATVLFALAACGGTETIPAEEAEPHYDAMMADVQEVMTELGYPLEHNPDSRRFEVIDDECVYTAGGYESTALSSALVHESNWSRVLDAVDPVFEEHGFATSDSPTRKGAFLMVQVDDGFGATFTLGGYAPVRVSGARTDPDACDGG